MKVRLTALLILLAQIGFGQAPVRKITDLSFMSGKWVTKGQWGDMDDVFLSLC
jgi:hypothetical protein